MFAIMSVAAKAKSGEKSRSAGEAKVVSPQPTSLVSQRYLMVSEVDDDPKRVEPSAAASGDTKLNPLENKAVAVARPLRLFAPGSRSRYGKAKGRFEAVRTILTVGASVDGVAATAYTTVINIRPGGTTEYSSWGNLYDEVKVHGGVLHYLWRIKTSSASEGTVAVGILAYDPTQNSVLANVENGLQHTQHQWCALPQNDAVPGFTSPVMERGKGGMQHFRFKCPEGTQRVPGTAGVCTGQWCDTTTTTADWGYIKPYINGVTGQTFLWTYSLELDVEFRSRS